CGRDGGGDRGTELAAVAVAAVAARAAGDEHLLSRVRGLTEGTRAAQQRTQEESGSSHAVNVSLTNLVRGRLTRCGTRCPLLHGPAADACNRVIWGAAFRLPIPGSDAVTKHSTHWPARGCRPCRGITGRRAGTAAAAAAEPDRAGAHRPRLHHGRRSGARSVCQRQARGIARRF